MISIQHQNSDQTFKLKALAFIITNTLMVNTAMAANYTVTSTTDDGNIATAGSLSWAITQANLSFGNTIIIDATVATITATGTLPTMSQSVTVNSDHNVAIMGTVNTDVLTTLTGGGIFSFTGGQGGPGVNNPGIAGNGGNGGNGVSGSGFTLTNNSTITGGQGGNGGNATSIGGNGGNGGVAIYATGNATIYNCR